MIRYSSFSCLVFAVSLSAELAQSDENQVYVITGPEHSVEEMSAAAGEIPPVKYDPPVDRWQHLPRTAAALAKPGGELRIVMLGDSIVNDTARSRWGDQLQARYPGCKISVVAVVRGGTGCWWYKEAGRVERYVVPQHPDLLIVGGISEQDDVDSIREVIAQVRAAGRCDVLLMTGAFGEVDPNDVKQWSFEIPKTPPNYRARLRDLAAELHVDFLDMAAHWGRYIRESGRPLEWFKRDPIHANVRGEQVLGHILATHFSPQPARRVRN